MTRRRWLAVGAIGLLIAAGSWWWFQPVQPDRPPELFGTIEQIRTSRHGPQRYLIRCRQPDPGVEESSQNAWQRQHAPHMWIWVRDDTPVRRRQGGTVQLAQGQTVSVWCTTTIEMTDPPQWPADFVVVEPDGP